MKRGEETYKDKKKKKGKRAASKGVARHSCEEPPFFTYGA